MKRLFDLVLYAVFLVAIVISGFLCLVFGPKKVPAHVFELDYMSDEVVFEDIHGHIFITQGTESWEIGDSCELFIVKGELESVIR